MYQAVTEGPAKSRNLALIFSAGFALFSMFFGAGNLVYPLTIGAEVGHYYPIATLGFLLTGVLVPFMGLLTIVVSKGSYGVFFSTLGKYGSFLIPLALMLLIGPFGATPRVISVGYGSLLTLFPDLNIYAYAVVTGLVIYYLVFDRNQLVKNIGNYLTPVLLICVACIIVLGFYYAGEAHAQWEATGGLSFVHGLQEGYLTMDLLATYFFAVILIGFIKSKAEQVGDESLNILIVKAMGIGITCLSIIYVAFIYLGAHYADLVRSSTPDQALSLIAHHIMGPYAAPIVCIAYVLACLTTAVALVSAFSEFIYENLFKERISMHACIIMTITISCLVSTLRFTGIALYLSPLVTAMYPGLILITVLSLLRGYFEFPYTKQLFYFIFFVNIFYVFFSTPDELPF